MYAESCSVGAVMEAPQGKGMFVSLLWGCMATASILEGWVRLGPELVNLNSHSLARELWPVKSSEAPSEPVKQSH